MTPYIKFDTLSGIAVYVVIVLIGSNIVSNVPLVLLLSDYLLHSEESPAMIKRAWLLLSFVSTIAGNLTLVGSVANLIVVERSKHSYHLEFWEYLKFGLPSTLLIVVIGTGLMLLFT